MILRLRLLTAATIPVCVEGILPETTIDLSLAKTAKLAVWHGNRRVELGQLFDVSKTGTADNRSPDEIRWEGDLSSVHWIGKGMNFGKMVIDGEAGRHLGSQMQGGSIRVNGNVGDYVGCEMRGGTIRIDGNAGDWVGAVYPGTKSGTNRGFILVQGNVGRAVGFAMRRGTICIGGNVQRLAGWNMLGGTLVVAGQSGAMTGKGMVRGTVILSSEESALSNRSGLPPTFSEGGPFQGVVIRALASWMKDHNVQSELASSRFRIFHGDHLKGGRGEILISD